MPDSTARPLRFVYYCSGHGYGHATRVSAVASHLLKLDEHPEVHIVSSAPKHVFADSIELGACYRNANIDPVIVQPLAYRVDRQKSVDVLRTFLQDKDRKISDEAQWLLSIKADCVLSDAAFLGCAAANAAGTPSILITNFSFDSVYSYLSTPFVDQDVVVQQQANGALLQAASDKQQVLDPDTSISTEELKPLVQQIIDGYRCADLLLRLPGYIPLPSFAVEPALPSPQWVDLTSRKFYPNIVHHLTKDLLKYKLHPQIPFPAEFGHKSLSRRVLQAPLVVRPPNPAVYTSKGRSRLLDSIGIPSHFHDPARTKILLVSFGGQIFHKPHSRSHSRSPSAASTPNSNGSASKETVQQHEHSKETHAEALSNALRTSIVTQQPSLAPSTPRVRQSSLNTLSRNSSLRRGQLRIVGAPPAAIPASPTIPTFTATPPTPRPLPDNQNPFIKLAGATNVELEEEEVPPLFPDDSWIAVVCGVPKDWGKEDGEELPDNFFVAPKDVYMPDLTAVADVLLGKLGYGTVSECVDSCTPFVFVPRPLFIEEFGLRMLLEREGVGIEMSRTAYESGEWAHAIHLAWMKGKEAKARKREEGETGRRQAEGKEMAEMLVDWVKEWNWERDHACTTR